VGGLVADELYTGDLDVASVQTRDALVVLLGIIHVRADKPSLRALEASTRHESTPLTKTVVSEMLKGTRLPRKAVMISFLRTCGVPEEAIEPWRRAWERVAVGEQSPNFRRPPPTRDQPTDNPVDPTWSSVEDHTEETATYSIPRHTPVLAPEPTRVESPDAKEDSVSAKTAAGPQLRRRELSAELRSLRNTAGLTIEQVAASLMCSPSKVSRMESGNRTVTLRDVRDLCALYQVTDSTKRDHLMELAREGRKQGWWQSYGLPYGTYIGLEADANSISCYNGTLIDGLLQTTDYSRVLETAGWVERDAEQIERRVAVRLRRQSLLDGDSPLRLRAMIDESALHRVMGNSSIMKAQLNHLVEISRRTNVTIRIIPYTTGAHAALDSIFTILEFPGTLPGIVYVEGLFGSIYLERAQDMERYQHVFSLLETIAASEDESIELISRISRSYELARACLDLSDFLD
jgi:transcriptional regulator with XRE-family HTH domain